MNFTPLNVSLDEACIPDFIRRFHFNQTDKREILKVARVLLPRVHAQFHYVVEDKDKSLVKETKAEKVATVVVTLGKAFDELQESYAAKKDIHGAYIIDCLGLELLSRAYDELDDKLHELTGLYAGDYIFAGEDRLPLGKLPDLMTKLGQKIVTYNEAYVLIPKKSVVVEIPLFKRKTKKHGLCAFCDNEDCELRREPRLGAVKAAAIEHEQEKDMEKKERGLTHLYTGDGKGKTTAAIGLAVRAAGAGKKVIFAQFMKGRDTSEIGVLCSVPGITVLRNDKDLGWFKKDDAKQAKAYTKVHDQILDEIETFIMNDKCDVLILDEVTYPYNYGIIDKDRLSAIIERSFSSDNADAIEIVLTGRDAPRFMQGVADYITQMSKVRHPFDSGIPAREGIEF